MYANNETGVIMPILKLGKAIAQLNQERKKKQLHEVLFHTDAAQIIGKDDVNFESLNAHYLTVVGHKFYGPRIGCIVAKQALHPMLFGGGQEKGIRPGTENTPMIVGLGIAAELVKTNLANYRSHMLQCRNQLERRLVEVFGNQIVINCEQSERLPNTTNISFKMLGLEGFLVLRQCKSLLASVGAACHNNSCSQILLNSGVLSDLAKNAIRLSCGRETTIQDIEKVVMDLQSAVSQLQVNLC